MKLSISAFQPHDDSMVNKHSRIAPGMVVRQSLERLFFTSSKLAPDFVQGGIMGTYRPLLTSHLGDSGTNQINTTWRIDGKPCKADGIRQDQLVGIWNVPKVCDKGCHIYCYTRKAESTHGPCSTKKIKNTTIRSRRRVHSDETMADAHMILPKYQRVLYIDVACAR